MHSHKQSHLGVPRYIGSGSFDNDGVKYRFMIMDRFGQDVEKLFLASGSKFALHTVFGLGLRIIEALEYLHEQEYVHADIKGSNLLTGFGDKNSSRVYLVDYGLAYRYCPSGEHVPYKEDPKRKHDGTIEYTSRDAHKGLAPSRRGDLEVLSYCMLQWLCSKLPWEDNLNNKDYVMNEKLKFMTDIDKSLKACFGSSRVPEQLKNFFKYVNKLEYTERPDYDQVKKWFRDALKKTEHPDDGKSVHFDAFAPGKKAAVGTTVKAKSPGKSMKRPRQKDATITKDDEYTSPNKSRKSSSPLKKSPSNIKGAKTATKKVKRLSSQFNKPKAVGSSRRVLVSGKKSAVGTRSSPRSKVASTAALNTISASSRGRIRARRKNDVETVDFAQSP